MLRNMGKTDFLETDMIGTCCTYHSVLEWIITGWSLLLFGVWAMSPLTFLFYSFCRKELESLKGKRLICELITPSEVSYNVFCLISTMLSPHVLTDTDTSCSAPGLDRNPSQICSTALRSTTWKTLFASILTEIFLSSQNNFITL